jgi:phospholipase C
MGPLSRRQVLAGGAAAAGLGLSSGLGHIIERAYAAEPTPCAPLSDIEHVIFVMQENRSFDHYFGRYRKPARGFEDPKVLRQPGGRPVFDQRGYSPEKGAADDDAFLPPWHLNTRDLASFAECVDDITHAWGPQHRALDSGRMDDWLKVHLAEDGNRIGPSTMGYYDRRDLPFYYALADAFTLCDGYFCSVIGPTDPNRVMWFSATIDPDGEHGGPVLDTNVLNRIVGPGNRRGQYTWTTMPEVLQEAGVSWKVYSDATSDALLNPLPYFKAYNRPGTPFFAAAYAGLRENTVLGEKPVLGTFQLDVIADKLPQVSWLFPSFEACEHPSAPPSLGEAFISQVLNTLVRHPRVWEKTAMFVMYDENGGFFDHVAPPTAPPGTPGEYLTAAHLPAAADGIRGPVGLGFRVPMMVLSPYSRGGLISSDTFDHTSQLKFLETRFGTEVPNLSAWRRKTVGDLTSAFNFAAKPVASAPRLPIVPSIRDVTTIAGECLINGVGGVEDLGKPTPVPEHVTKPSQEQGPAGRPSGLDCSVPLPGSSGGEPTPGKQDGGNAGDSGTGHSSGNSGGSGRGGGSAPAGSSGRAGGNGHPHRGDRRLEGRVARNAPSTRALGSASAATRSSDTLAATGVETGIPLGAAVLTALAALVYRLRSRRDDRPRA